MSLAHVIVDVFTDTPLQGKQLAVFEDGPALSDDPDAAPGPGDELARDRLPASGQGRRCRRCRTTNGGYAAARYSSGSAAGAQTRALSRPLLPSGFRPPAPLITSVP